MGNQEAADPGLDKNQVILFGTETCKICKAAEEKLIRMGISYRKIDLAKCAKAELPPDWREIDLAGAQALYELWDMLPWIRIGETLMIYAEAMRVLKAGPPKLMEDKA